jgi:hypothetical protein
MRRATDIAVMPDGRRIRLSPGGHASPGEGACVVELASLIANEEFSDRPRCVCPVIGSFLRGLNDRAAHAERQRLVPYAPRIVGSRADRPVTRRRRDMCLEWAGANLRRGPVRRLLSKVAIRMRMALFCGVGVAIRANEGAGDYAARVALARGDAAGAFELLDALLAVGDQRVPTRSAPAATRNGRPSPNGDGSADANGSGAVPIGSDGHPATPGVAPTLNGEPTPNGEREGLLSARRWSRRPRSPRR